MSPEGNPDCVTNSERHEERGRGKEGEVAKEETEKRQSEKSGKERNEEQRRKNTLFVKHFAHRDSISFTQNT